MKALPRTGIAFALLLAAALPARAIEHAVQMQTLHEFFIPPIDPLAPLIQAADGTLYGTTHGGGTKNLGAIFKFTTNGDLTWLWQFTGGGDGANPWGGLTLATNGMLYGTTYAGGTNNVGAIFAITTNGVLTPLWSFTGGADGEFPRDGLMQASNGLLYGTAFAGGTNNGGTIFEITLDGNITPLWSFQGGVYGALPCGGLVQGDDGNLYGTTVAGGAFGGPLGYGGTLFRTTTGGTFTSLWSFSSSGTQGANPFARLLKAGDGALYGTTMDSGTNSHGTIFRFTTNGSLTIIWSFTGGADGDQPYIGSLLMQAADGMIYGTTPHGGTNGDGSIYRIATNGVLTPFWSFRSFTDGSQPFAALIQAFDGALYGTTFLGGAYGDGTIFKISTSGVFTQLASFGSGTAGASPHCHLVQGGDGTLYGTTFTGGTNGNSGTVFTLATDNVLRLLWSFSSGADGCNPYAGLAPASDGTLYATSEGAAGTSNRDHSVVFKITTNGNLTPIWTSTGGTNGSTFEAGLLLAADGALYGTAQHGGTNDQGIVFRIRTNGVFNSLWLFTGGADGANPSGDLVQAPDGAFYGSAYSGGTNNFGTVFKIRTNGVLTPLWSFTGGADGANPFAGLLLAPDGMFYGTTVNGGASNSGTVFKITTNGVMTPLWSFTGGADGAAPYAALMLGSNGLFYGATVGGGSNGYGAVFSITTNGVLTPLWSFRGWRDGKNPYGTLMQGMDGALYGTCEGGGTNGAGTVFRIWDLIGYDAWALHITNGIDGCNESATADGYANLLKYAMGSSPTNPDALARLSVQSTDGFVSLQFTHDTNSVDVRIIVEANETLTNDASWFALATNVNGSWGGATNVIEVVSNSPAAVTVQDGASGPTNRFLRLRVMRP